MFDRSLVMSFHTFNCPSHALAHTHMYTHSCRMRLNPVLAIRPSSILLQTDESDNLPESRKNSVTSSKSTKSLSADSLVNHRNTVGIVGGVSVNSTLSFIRKLVEWSSKDGESCPPFVLCSDPELNEELRLYENSSFPSLYRKTDCLLLDPKTIAENLHSKQSFLERSGARCIVMPCHVSHTWHEEISKGCLVPFLHIGECVAEELVDAKMKPLEAGSPLRIGVLGTNATLSSGFYQEKLQDKGFEVVLPDKATMEHTVIPAIDALNRKDLEGARNLLRIALQVLLVRAVNTVILAADDMRDLLPRDDPLLKKCVDPVDALVRSTIKWARTTGEGI